MILKPFQVGGSIWLSQRDRALLGDDPGLGKTRTALAAAQLRKAGKVLVFAPAIARAVWEREADKIGFLGDIATLSYQKVVRDLSQLDAFKGWPDLVILDEFHYLKHAGSKRSQYVLQFQAPAIWGLSGTPMPRNPFELYAISRAFWPREVAALGLYTPRAWLDYFTFWRATRYGPRVYGTRNHDVLRRFLDGKMLRRREIDVLPELPPWRWTVMPVDPTFNARRDAEALADSLTAEEQFALEHTPEVAPSGNIAHARHVLGDIKADLVGPMIAEELRADPTNAKRVVFAYHRSVLDALENHLSEFGVTRVDGSTSRERAARRVADFQDPWPNSPRVFLGQTEAAGVAITLTAANHVDLVEPDWRTDFNIQAGKRVHRIGQELPVWVRMHAMADTLDEAIVNQHHREVAMVTKVLD